MMLQLSSYMNQSHPSWSNNPLPPPPPPPSLSSPSRLEPQEPPQEGTSKTAKRFLSYSPAAKNFLLLMRTLGITPSARSPLLKQSQPLTRHSL
jgi:hypothetical protein